MNRLKSSGIFILILFSFTLNAYGKNIDLPGSRGPVEPSLKNYLAAIDSLRFSLQTNFIPKKTMLGILKNLKVKVNSLKSKVNDLLKDRGRVEAEKGMLRVMVDILNNLAMMIDSLIAQLDYPNEEGIIKTYYQLKERTEDLLRVMT